jgi:2-methylisocitrate lyase-like PEP mutase family enzyme
MTFADLHHRDRPLLLPNAWDVPSALAFLDAGFEAIGTTSFGVASSIGRPDGARSTKDANLGLARQLSRLAAYVSLDVEDGYADEPDQVADYVAQLDVAGINIEDSSGERLIPVEAHAGKVAAIKRRRPDLFVNARVDTYWLGQDATVETTLERAARYVAAGADGVFVPGAAEPDVLRKLTSAIAVPVNVLVTPALSFDELAELGVRRVSTGSLPYRAAIHAAVEVAAAVRDGRSGPDAVPYADLQARLVQYAQRSQVADGRDQSAPHGAGTPLRG